MGDDVFQVSTPPPGEYQAAGGGRRLWRWSPPLTGPNAATTGAKQTIVGRSRAGARNNPWAGTASDKIVANAIGTGIQAKTRNGSKAFKKQVKKLWDRWCKWSDADWVLDFYGQQALVMREWDEAGEVFVRLRKRRLSDGLPVPLQVQLIEAEQCPAEHWGTAKNGNAIRAGIEFDKIGRRVAYYMYRTHPGDQRAPDDSGELVRVGADEVVHVYLPKRAGQLRGLPHATSALVREFNLDAFEDAVQERQKLANLFTGFWVDDTEDGGENTTEGLATDVDIDGTPLAGLEPGTVVEGPPGKKLQFSTPPDAGPNYPAYWRSQMLAICARRGVPYEVLTGDLKDVSDRALKLILNEFRRLIEQWQWLTIIPLFCQMVREAWWDQAVLAGLLEVEDYADNREDYVDTLWVPQGWPYSHPVQDLEADKGAVRSGFTSRTSVVLANGEDPEEVDEQNAADNSRADDLEVAYDSDGRRPAKGGGPAEGGAPTSRGPAPAPESPPAAAAEQVRVMVEASARQAQVVSDAVLRLAQAVAQQPPAAAPVVNVAPPAVTVNVPAAPPAEIHIAPPAVTVESPVVTVNMPPAPAPAELSEREAAILAAAERKIEEMN